MKKLLFLIAMVYSVVITAQHQTVYAVIAINHIPLTIQTNYHVDSFPTSGIISEFFIISDTIQIGVLEWQQEGVANNLYTIHPPFTKQQLQQIQFREILFHLKDRADQPWVNLFSHKKSQLTIKHFLAIGHHLIVQFRLKEQQTILQELRIHRISPSPYITASRQKIVFDSTDINLHSQLIKNRHVLPKDFKTFSGKMVTVQPGTYLELLIGGSPMNKDSVIRYQLLDANYHPYTNWLLTGHYLSIPQLQKGKKSILQLQYLGANTTVQYQINSLSFWYESLYFMYTIVCMLMGLLLYLPFIFHKRRLKKKQAQFKQALESISAIQSKLNPHFVYNALSSIQGLIQGNDKDAASDYLARFSVMMRSTLDNSHQIFISLSEEMAMLECYLSIEQLRFGFQFTIDIDSRVLTHQIQCPPMLLQPSVENAVKHGVASLRANGYIHIQLNQIGKGFEVLIQDNGIQPHPYVHREGNGIKLTKDRIKYLQELGNDVTIHYQMKQNEIGCLVRFYFEIMND